MLLKPGRVDVHARSEELVLRRRVHVEPDDSAAFVPGFGNELLQILNGQRKLGSHVSGAGLPICLHGYLAGTIQGSFRLLDFYGLNGMGVWAPGPRIDGTLFHFEVFFAD